ncbi:MAG: amidohydrolase family protein [Cyclobacteriaceae bacterium]
MRIAVSIFLACALLWSCQPEKQPQTYEIAIHNATIIDIQTGKLSRDRHILIDATGKISLSEKVLPAVNTIDASGKFAMPALWDMHAHFRGGEKLIEENKKLLPLYVGNGVTTVRDAGGDLTEQIFQWRTEIKAKKLTGPYLYTSGPKIDGPGARWAGSLEVSTKGQADLALDSLEALKVDFVKLYDSKLSAELYLYLLEACNERGMKVSGHMPFTVMLQDAIDRKVTSIEHLYYVLKGCSLREAEITEKIRNGELSFWGSMEELMESYSDSLADIRMKNMKATEVFVVPTLHIGKVLSYLDQEDHTDDPALSLIGSGIRKTYEGRINSASRADEKAIKRRHLLHQAFRKLAVKLQQSGVKLLAGSDAGAYNSYVYPGFSLHDELQLMVESGIEPLAALQTATLNAAAYFGLDSKNVLIGEGSKTDILLLDENPLEDISNTQAIHGLIIDGQYLDKTALNKLLNR